MKSLAQIRAAHAYKFWTTTRHEGIRGEAGEEITRALASLILNSGLLAAVVFAKGASNPDRRGGYEEIMLEVGRFLSSPERNVLPFPVAQTDDLIRGLTSHPSSLLPLATAEALEYLNYLRRLRAR